MTTLDPILVTGATSNVGPEVVGAMQVTNLPFVAAGSDPERVRRRLGSDARNLVLDLADPAIYENVLRDIKRHLLLRSPPLANLRDNLSVLVDWAMEAGIDAS